MFMWRSVSLTSIECVPYRKRNMNCAGMVSESPVKNPSSDSSPLKKRTGAVETNDRFMKVTEVLEDTRNVWLVSQKLDLAGLPPHVRIIDERAPRRSLTLSVSALLDKRLYHRLESAPRMKTRSEQESIESAQGAGAQAAEAQDSENVDPMAPNSGVRR